MVHLVLEAMTTMLALLAQRLSAPHVAAVELAVFIAVERRKLLGLLRLYLVERHGPITIHIEPALHAVGSALHHLLQRVVFNFLPGKRTVAIRVRSLDVGQLRK